MTEWLVTTNKQLRRECSFNHYPASLEKHKAGNPVLFPAFFSSSSSCFVGLFVLENYKLLNSQCWYMLVKVYTLFLVHILVLGNN